MKMSTVDVYWRELRYRQVIERGKREFKVFNHVILPAPMSDNDKLRLAMESMKRQDYCYQQRAEAIFTNCTPIKSSL